MKKMLQKALLGMMLLSLLITGILIPSLAEEALVTEAPVTEAPLAETVVEEEETVVPTEEPIEEVTPVPEKVPAQQPAEVPAQTAEAAEEIQVPEGFDVAVLQAARATSACQHKNLWVNSECEYTDTVKLDETYHVYTITYTSRSLVCDDCGDVIQTIAWNRVEQHRYRHTWYNFNSKEKNHMYCEDCGATKVIKYPCSHKSLFFAEDGIYHCGKCDAIWDPWTDSYEPSGSYICPHRSYTIHYPGEIGTLYCQDWNETSHLRVYAKLVYDEDTPSSSYMATCDDCGSELHISDGKIAGVNISSPFAFWETDHSVLEPHTLVGGVCGECGYTVEPPVYQPAPKPKKITLSPAGTVYVNLGDTLNLDVISDPENAEFSLTWKTSNGRVATVENGQVRGVSEGSVRITATTNNGKSASVTVKVVDPYKPTKVTLDKTGTVQLNLGETLTLTPSLTPSTAQADYTWKTSSAKIATVSGGVVTPVGEGTATITVTAVRGKVKKTATVKIKVVDPYKPTKVTLDKTGTVQLNLGETLTLTPSLTPSTAQADYTWKTSSAKIATVSGGVVTPVGEGTATITVTAVRGKVKKTATVKIKVVDPYKPTKVTLDKTGTVQLNLGETLTLTPSLTPATAQADYTWKSSSAKIATVSGGVVTPVGEGTATITVTAVRGKVKKTAKVKIKVVDPYKPTKVTLDKTGTVQLNLGETLQLTPSLTPATAQADYTWKTSSAKIATVSGGVVTPVGEGTATITVTAIRGKVKKTAKVKIKVVDPMKPTRVSLNETGTCWLPLGNTLQLYPRTAPVDLDSTKGEVTYNWKSSSAKVATVDQNGIVYPVGKGTATITVTATRGKVKKTASVKVKVVAPDVADTLIFMQNGTALTSLKLSLGQMAFIGVSVRPYTASNVQISYTSSKPQTASVETSPSGEVVVMGLNPGTTTITATDTISGKKTTLKVTVTK